MRRHARLRFSLELVLSVVSGLLLLATLVDRRWIEFLGFDPDHGSSGAERAMAVGSFVLAVTAALLAKREFRRSTEYARPSS